MFLHGCSFLFLSTALLLFLVEHVFTYLFVPIHGPAERRNLISKFHAGKLSNATNPVEYDTVEVTNFLRTYRKGPVEDEYVYTTHDVLAVYSGPGVTKPTRSGVRDKDNGTVHIRQWAMMSADFVKCELQGIYDYGQFATFACHEENIYTAYAIDREVDSSNFVEGELQRFAETPTLTWLTYREWNMFDLLEVEEYSGNMSAKYSPLLDIFKDALDMEDRKKKLLENKEIMVVSDPVVVTKTFHCYTWMYYLEKKSKVGFVGDVVAPKAGSNGTSYIHFELRIWVAEAGAVQFDEESDTASTIHITKYSSLLTNRFADIGLVPCLRHAHPSIEVMRDVQFILSSDQTNPLGRAPRSSHWLMDIKVHTDRLITTLTDVSFYIASRQNTASFHCFVANTRVLINLRRFEFVPRMKLERQSINLEDSNIWQRTAKLVKHNIKHVYGHGVQFLGNEWSKVFQPSTSRADAVIISNPCVAQEFAMSVGGSLYVVDSLLRSELMDVTKVFLPDFSFADGKIVDPKHYRGYLRVLDVAFTPTHLAILMADGSVTLHTSSVSQKGIARLTNTEKYKPSAFVKRRWCPKTVTPKFSNLMLPMFSRSGSVVILQLFPTEGNIRMWMEDPPPTCISEGAGFVGKAQDFTKVINETDIHYNEYVQVMRTDQKTGLTKPQLPERPEPPPPPARNLDEELTFILNNGEYVQEQEDPHYPLEFTNPASQILSDTLVNYNEAVIYVLFESNHAIAQLLRDNGINNILTSDPNDQIGLYTAEFTAVEKQFIVAARFKAREVPKNFSAIQFKQPFQMLVTTVTVSKFPSQVKLLTDHRAPDEDLDTIMPFPGVIIVRSKAFEVGISGSRSRDPDEQLEHEQALKGADKLEYTPEIFTMNTAVPSYVIDFGDVLLYSSLEGTYARPLHYYNWTTIESKTKCADKRKNKNETLGSSSVVEGNYTTCMRWKTDALNFSNDASLTFDERFYDVLVTEQGVVSVLYRKKHRHIIQDEATCMQTPDTETQAVLLGSVLSLEGLREVKPFFRNTNIFQRTTLDGEVIYGSLDVKPHSPFQTCQGSAEETIQDPEVCIQQAPPNAPKGYLPVCTADKRFPCRDPAFIPMCSNVTQTDACLRSNNFSCRADHQDGSFIPPLPPLEGLIINGTNACPNVRRNNATSGPYFASGCLPKHAPREELRAVKIIGTSFLSYLLGSIKTVKSLHPEAPPAGSKLQEPKEPNVCPFSNFKVHYSEIDFAEVGYQTRITAQISYFGQNIPTEAELLVHYERFIGIVVRVTSAVQAERDLTTITKTIDISFKMTDYTLHEFKATSEDSLSSLDYASIRAREKAASYSVTLTPSVVNMRCKNTDFFKTIQFNVGCNAFSTIRLISEAAPLQRINWTEHTESSSANFRWIRDLEKMELTMPKAHIYSHQLSKKQLVCDQTHCKMPYFHLFKNEIFTIHFRDLFHPKFEQFLTVSSRRVTGNVIIYDFLGSNEYNLTVNKLSAGCFSDGRMWFKNLLASTKNIGTQTNEHENIYKYYEDCFDTQDERQREHPLQLNTSPFHLYNLTNRNRIKFQRQRNHIFIFRAVVVNTYYNRFTYCKFLDTFFMIRVVGVPIPRQGLALWHYILVMLCVVVGLFVSYVFFYRFYTWKLDLGATVIDDDDDIPWQAGSGDQPIESDHLIRHMHDRLPPTRKNSGGMDETSD